MIMDKIRFFVVNVLILLGVVTSTMAQKECPEEWQAYTSDKYFSCLQPGENEEIKPEDDFLSGLEKNAVNRLLKSVKVAVHNYVALQTLRIDEDAVVGYLEENGYDSNVGSKIIEKNRFYNNYTHHGCAIAYIEKESASKSYCNDITSSQKHINEALAKAKNYIAAGHNDSARFALEDIVPKLKSNSSKLILLRVFNCNPETIDALREKHMQCIVELKDCFKTIGPKIMVAVDYSADVFGSPYWDMQESIKDWLATRGYGYTTDKTKANWTIVIRSNSRKYNTMSNGTQTTYYSYVDANLTLQKVSEDKPVYDNKLSIKGSFLKSYNEAAYAAYRDLETKVLKILEDNIK